MADLLTRGGVATVRAADSDNPVTLQVGLVHLQSLYSKITRPACRQGFWHAITLF